MKRKNVATLLLLLLICSVAGITQTRPDYSQLRNAPFYDVHNVKNYFPNTAPSSAEITTAIQEALDDAYVSGKYVYLPDWDSPYIVDSTIEIPDGVTLVGQGIQNYTEASTGSVIRAASTFATSTPLITMGLGARLKDIYLICHEERLTDAPLMAGVLLSEKWGVLENVTIRNLPIGVKVDGSWGFKLSNVHAHNNLIGFQIKTGTSFLVEKCGATVPRVYGFDFPGGGAFNPYYGVFNGTYVDGPTATASAAWRINSHLNGITFISPGFEVGTSTADMFKFDTSANGCLSIVSPFVSKYAGGSWTGNVFTYSSSNIITSIQNIFLSSTALPASPGVVLSNPANNNKITFLGFASGGSTNTSDNELLMGVGIYGFSEQHIRNGGTPSIRGHHFSTHAAERTARVHGTYYNIFTPTASSTHLLTLDYKDSKTINAVGIVNNYATTTVDILSSKNATFIASGSSIWMKHTEPAGENEYIGINVIRLD